MHPRRRLLLLIPAAALVLCLLGSFLTRGAMANLQFLQNHPDAAGGSGDLVDTRPLQTAEALLPLAVSVEEQGFAQEAFRLADHEVDQAFDMALRQATVENRTLTGKALEVSQEVAGLQQMVKDDQAAVDALTKGAGPTAAAGSDLEVAKAQLALDSDELTDTQNNLAVVSGDKRAKIQEELTTHEAGMKKYDDHMEGGQLAVISARRYGTLAGRLKAWFDQRSRMALLGQAQAQADADAATLTEENARLWPKTAALSGTERQTRSAAADPTRLGMLRTLQTQRNIIGILAGRIAGQKELSANYAKWLAQVELQHRILLHLLLQSFAWVAFIVLCAVMLAMLVRAIAQGRMAKRAEADRRSTETLLTVLNLAIEVVALLAILLVIFGPPSQMPTILGLATAGVTVVFQDHILAFFGWFVLMGRNGLRVGDWVEISGVGGEVVEIGLFRTTLLETGNWTDKGHPTGRRISFVNKFAMSGQYFNFSTNGQWLWDEITVNIPVGDDAFALVDRIRQALVTQTADDAALASKEWQRSTQQNVFSQFSATPSVEMRPAAAGIDLVIRYVTRASERLEMRNRLSQAVIQLMRTPAASPP